MHRTTSRLLPFALVALVGLVLAACGGGAASAIPSASASPPAADGSASPPAGEPSDAGTGAEPGVPDSERVDPQPGQQNVLSIPIERFAATVEGRTATITVHWSSGVAPCSVLDQVLVNVSDETVDVTIREGTSDPSAVCMLVLQAKHTVVTVDLEPGTYTVRDTEGVAAPVELTVS